MTVRSLRRPVVALPSALACTAMTMVLLAEVAGMLGP